MRRTGGLSRLNLLGFTLVIGVAVVVAACSNHKSSTAPSSSDKLGDVHGDPGISKAANDQILNAAAQVTAQVSQADLVARGRQLFFSTSVAKAGESCGTCHINGGGVNAQVGTIHHPTKAGDFTGPRDPIQLWGVGRTAPYLWDGKTATLEQQTTNVILNFFKAGSTQPATTTASQMAAVVAYMRTLEPPRTAFDNGQLSPLAKQGQALFEGKDGCATCHSGPNFTDNRVHVVGVPTITSKDTDPGNPGVPGAFNTPGLRDVKDTAPYMHNGKFATLKEVLGFYDNNKTVGTPPIPGPDRDAIIAYLESL